MPDPAAPRRRFSDALRGAAIRSADVAYAQGRQAFFSAERRTRGLRNASEHMAGRMFRAGQRFIEKSPIPVPELAKEAFTRMQDALRQLGHVIESGDVSSFRDKGHEAQMRRQGKVEIREAEAQIAQSQPLASHSKQRPRASN